MTTPVEFYDSGLVHFTKDIGEQRIEQVSFYYDTQKLGQIKEGEKATLTFEIEEGKDTPESGTKVEMQLQLHQPDKPRFIIVHGILSRKEYVPIACTSIKPSWEVSSLFHGGRSQLLTWEIHCSEETPEEPNKHRWPKPIVQLKPGEAWPHAKD